jgi:uncharacterized protein
MRRYYLLIVFLFLISVSFANAILVSESRYVKDYTGVLNLSGGEELKSLFRFVYENTTAEIVFVSLDSINGSDIGKYATNLGNVWQIGGTNNNEGLVILYVKDVNKIYAATGYGLESVLTNSKIGELLDEYYVPYRDSGKLQEGIVLFSHKASEVILDNADALREGKTPNRKWDWKIKAIIVMGILAISVIIIAIVGVFTKLFERIFPFLPAWAKKSGSNKGSMVRIGGGNSSGGGFGGGGGGR